MVYLVLDMTGHPLAAFKTHEQAAAHAARFVGWRVMSLIVKAA